MARTRPWGRAIVWLAFLIPMFFGSYIAALEIVATYDHVPTLVYGWERHVPFLAWTVVPYWSIDFFYGVSLFLCATPLELSRHARRLVTAQAVAIPIFLSFPLRLTSTIPADTGIFAPFFGALEGMVGKPFNLAPSLHIALLVILWARYARHVPYPWRLLVDGWATLIGVSVLTANQHHFFDVPTGALLGAFCVWAWPDEGTTPFARASLHADPRRWAVAGVWAAVSVGLGAVGFTLGGLAHLLLWPSLSAGFVAAAYASLGPDAFQKDAHGRHSLASKALFAPYFWLARANAWAWAQRLPPSAELAPGVHLGRVSAATSGAVVDLTGELAGDGSARWSSIPALDLLPPPPSVLADAARRVQDLAPGGVFVGCALGLSRSAATAVTWLAAFGDGDVDSAIARVRAARPQVVLTRSHRAAIEAAVAQLRGAP